MSDPWPAGRGRSSNSSVLSAVEVRRPLPRHGPAAACAGGAAAPASLQPDRADAPAYDYQRCLLGAAAPTSAGNPSVDAPRHDAATRCTPATRLAGCGAGSSNCYGQTQQLARPCPAHRITFLEVINRSTSSSGLYQFLSSRRSASGCPAPGRPRSFSAPCSPAPVASGALQLARLQSAVAALPAIERAAGDRVLTQKSGQRFAYFGFLHPASRGRGTRYSHLSLQPRAAFLCMRKTDTRPRAPRRRPKRAPAWG